jgi:phage recombination protein Bet
MSEENTEIEIRESHNAISENFGFTNEQVAVIQKTVAKNTTAVELAYFINVCKTVDLNPFIKEIWCYKDNRGNLLVFAGRDGFLAKAQRSPSFNGIRSSEVCEKDEFKIDIANNKITHEFGLKDRGNIIGAYALAFRKDGEPTIEYVDFKTYNKGRAAWSTHPAEMIKKVAETHALKKGFGISGLQSEYDFDVKRNGVAVPINTDMTVYDLTTLKELYNLKVKVLTEDDKLNIDRIIEEEEKSSYKKAIVELKKL